MKYLNALNTIEGLSAKKIKLLLDYFEKGELIWTASYAKLVSSGVGEALAQKISEKRPDIDVENEWAKLEQEDIMIVSADDSHYPALLKQIPDHPYLIYMKGDLECLNFPLIAIVGSRKLTEYGERVASGFARDLANSSVCVVSGLAFGIDAAAHSGALEAHGRTIAVLGNSLDAQSISPRSNFQLSQEILQGGGLLVSEFPVPTNADVWTFPARNRIMAGMSLGTLVVEAAEKSGSLITANLALDYNREVFAVPGPIFSPQSTGTHHLIKAGAKLVTCAGDVLSELRLEKMAPLVRAKVILELTTEEKKVYATVSHENLHIDRIAKLTKLETSTISSILAMLEIKGAVRNVGGQNYIRI